MRAVKTWKGWTPSQERALAALRAEGLTIRECAARMGRTYAAVKCQLMRHPDRYPRRTRLERYHDALQVIHTIPGVAEAMGVDERSVVHAKWLLRRKGECVGPAVRKDGRKNGNLRHWAKEARRA